MAKEDMVEYLHQIKKMKPMESIQEENEQTDPKITEGMMNQQTFELNQE